MIFPPLPQPEFNETKITISGLSPVTTYTFKVLSENGVTSLASSGSGIAGREFVEISVTTEASITSASVNNVRVTAVKASEVSLSWDPPLNNEATDDNSIETYEVSLWFDLYCDRVADEVILGNSLLFLIWRMISRMEQ